MLAAGVFQAEDKKISLELFCEEAQLTVLGRFSSWRSRTELLFEIVLVWLSTCSNDSAKKWLRVVWREVPRTVHSSLSPSRQIPVVIVYLLDSNLARRFFTIGSSFREARHDSLSGSIEGRGDFVVNSG